MTHQDETGRHVTDTIEKRVGVGPNDSVSGWQQFLARILHTMAPYLQAGRLVTFQDLLPIEKAFFRSLHAGIRVPPRAAALYIAPSVRHQMMYTNQQPRPAHLPAFDLEAQQDAGVLLASGANDHRVIVNALFAHPPCTPAIDVYESGQLIAGYTYYTIEECMAAIGPLLQVYLAPPGG
jgi:hypothetical protein